MSKEITENSEVNEARGPIFASSIPIFASVVEINGGNEIIVEGVIKIIHKKKIVNYSIRCTSEMPTKSVLYNEIYEEITTGVRSFGSNSWEKLKLFVTIEDRKSWLKEILPAEKNIKILGSSNIIKDEVRDKMKTDAKNRNIQPFRRR